MILILFSGILRLFWFIFILKSDWVRFRSVLSNATSLDMSGFPNALLNTYFRALLSSNFTIKETDFYFLMSVLVICWFALLYLSSVYDYFYTLLYRFAWWFISIIHIFIRCSSDGSSTNRKVFVWVSVPPCTVGFDVVFMFVVRYIFLFGWKLSPS